MKLTNFLNNLTSISECVAAKEAIIMLSDEGLVDFPQTGSYVCKQIDNRMSEIAEDTFNEIENQLNRIETNINESFERLDKILNEKVKVQ